MEMAGMKESDVVRMCDSATHFTVYNSEINF